MCNLYSITTNQAANRCALPRDQPVCRKPAADARCVSRLFGAADPECRCRARADHYALGNAGATARRRLSRKEHPQYVVAALAGLTEAGKPLPGTGQQLRGICA
jgi:hypothetical protein